MVRLFKPKETIDLYESVLKNKKNHFYYTEDNKRIFVEEFSSLKKLLGSSIFMYIDESQENEISGSVCLWKSIGGDKVRYYVKISYQDLKQAEKLLTVLLWNVSKEVFFKLEKNDPLYYIFRKQGFNFVGGRGTSILLRREKTPIRLNKYDKDSQVEYKKVEKFITK